MRFLLIIAYLLGVRRLLLLLLILMGIAIAQEQCSTREQGERPHPGSSPLPGEAGEIMLRLTAPRSALRGRRYRSTTRASLNRVARPWVR